MIKRRGAKVIVRRESDGKYLVLTGSVWPERPERSQKPDLPGGIVEEGETLAEGAIRELVEETGIVASVEQLESLFHGVLQFEQYDSELELALYLLDCADDPTVTLSWEHESYQWITRDDFKTLNIREPYKGLLESLLVNKPINAD